MYTENYEQTFVPKIKKKQYTRLNRFMFRNRCVVDLGSGPLDLLYKHVMKNGATSYHAVEKNEEYLKKLSEKLFQKPRVQLIVHTTIESFLESEELAQMSRSGKVTLVASGIERSFVKHPRQVEQKIAKQLRNGNRYLGLSSSFFMARGWISGKTIHRQKEGIYTFQNGDHIILAQTPPLPKEICIATEGVILGGGGRDFGEYDNDFDLTWTGE